MARGLAVSHAAIDRDHKQISNRARALHTAVLTLQGRDVLLPLIADLLAVTKAHFAEEERLMLANSCPEYESHRNEHPRVSAATTEADDEPHLLPLPSGKPRF